MIVKRSVLIVDDHKMIRDGLRFMLESQKNNYEFVIEEADTGETGVEKAKNNSYDIIIMDFQLPKINGAEATALIIKNNPNTKILSLSNYDEYMYIDSVLKAGAKGFVLKNIGPEELLKAIETIISGKNYYSSDVAIKLLSFENNEGKDIRYKNEKITGLSKREIEVLKLIADGFTNEEIANKLFISKRTVDTHRQNLLNKLSVKNTAGLVRYALEFFDEN